MNTTYRVVIKGVKDGATEEQVTVRLAALFKTTEEQVKKILASGGVPVKKGIDLQTAAKYQAAIEAAGASVIVEPEDAPKAVTPEIVKANLPASAVEAPRATVEKSETVAPISDESPAVLPINNGNAAVKAKLIDINNLSARDVIKATAIILILGFMGAMVFINGGSSFGSTLLGFITGDDRVDQAFRLIKMQSRDSSHFSLVSGKVIWDGKDIKGNPSYLVRIEYDAPDNIMGKTWRTCYLVPYIKVKKGVIYDTYDGLHPCGNSDNEKLNTEKLVQHYFVSGEIQYRD